MAEETRVIACLIEKDHTTPEQYPLSLNALATACNQQSNRHPVVAFDEATISSAISGLRERRLLRVVLPGSGSRTTKYRHVMDEVWGLTEGECAVLAVLALRGPQTVNELRARVDRYRGIEDLGGVPGVLKRLSTRYEEPYVQDLGRAPGQREERWTQLFGEPMSGASEAAVAAANRPPRQSASGEIAALRSELDALKEQVSAMETELSTLRSQLGG